MYVFELNHGTVVTENSSTATSLRSSLKSSDLDFTEVQEERDVNSLIPVGGKLVSIEQPKSVLYYVSDSNTAAAVFVALRKDYPGCDLG